MATPRAQLGEAVSSWIADCHPLVVTEIVVAQSSDSRFHCVTLVVFFHDPR